MTQFTATSDIIYLVTVKDGARILCPENLDHICDPSFQNTVRETVDTAEAMAEVERLRAQG